MRRLNGWAVALGIVLSLAAFAQAAKDNKLGLTVVDSTTDEPIAGVQIQGNQPQVTTDEAGDATITIDPNQQAYLRLSSPKYVTVNLMWQRGTDVPDSYMLKLDPGWKIGGLVVDEDGKPVGGADVTVIIPGKDGEKPPLMNNGTYERMKADKEGKWSFSQAPAKLDGVRVGATHRKFPAKSDRGSYDIEPVSNVEELSKGTYKTVLKKGVTITGTVTGKDGNPLAGASIGTGTDRFSSNVVPEVKTDAKGNYSIAVVPGSSATLTVKAKGHAPEMTTVDVLAEAKSGVDFKLKEGKVLTGVVLNADGTPAKRVTVVIDGWRGGRALTTQFRTDETGRFTWKEAPEDAVTVDVVAQGSLGKRGISMTAGKDVEVKLGVATSVKATVVDAVTGRPVPAFDFEAGLKWQEGRAVNWLNGQMGREYSGKGADGKFDWKVTQAYPFYVLRVQADGYMPTISREFKSDEGPIELKFELKKGTNLTGTIVDADGKPVAGEAYLAEPGQHVSITNGALDVNNGQNMSTAKVGADGKFSFPPRAEPVTIVAVTEAGFGLVDGAVADDSKPTEIKVKPWLTVEGVAKIGSKPAPVGTPVRAIFTRQDAVYDGKRPYINLSSRARTDAQGKFKFEKVQPGMSSVVRELVKENNTSYVDQKQFEFVPGKVEPIQIGGVGRTIVGKVVLPADLKGRQMYGHVNVQEKGKKIDFPSRNVPIETLEMTPEQIQEWEKKWRGSPEGIEWQKAFSKVASKTASLSGSVGPDGKFEVPGAVPGEYMLNIMMYPRDGGDHDSQRSTTTTVTVAEGSLDEPVTVPDLPLDKRTKINVGDPMPELSGGQTRGNPVNVSGPGKVRLLHFWYPMRDAVTQAKTLDKVMAANAGAIDVIGVGYVGNESPLSNAFMEKYEPKIAQRLLGNSDAQSLYAKIGNPQMPCVWIIGTDGKLVAKDVKADGLEAAVKNALGK